MLWICPDGGPAVSVEREGDGGPADRHVQAAHRAAPEAVGHRVRRGREPARQLVRDLPRDLRQGRGGVGRHARHDELHDARVVLRRALEAHRVSDHPDPKELAGLLGPAEARRIDVVDPVLGPHGAVDEVGQWLGTGVRPVPGPHSDFENEAIGGAVDQLDPGDAHLRVDEPAHALVGAVVSDAHPYGVREAGELRIREAVLVHAREETVERAAADLKDGLEVAGQWIRHGVPSPPACAYSLLMAKW